MVSLPPLPRTAARWAMTTLLHCRPTSSLPFVFYADPRRCSALFYFLRLAVSSILLVLDMFCTCSLLANLLPSSDCWHPLHTPSHLRETRAIRPPPSLSAIFSSLMRERIGPSAALFFSACDSPDRPCRAHAVYTALRVRVQLGTNRVRRELYNYAHAPVPSVTRRRARALRWCVVVTGGLHLTASVGGLPPEAFPIPLGRRGRPRTVSRRSSAPEPTSATVDVTARNAPASRTPNPTTRINMQNSECSHHRPRRSRHPNAVRCAGPLARRRHARRGAPTPAAEAKAAQRPTGDSRPSRPAPAIKPPDATSTRCQVRIQCCGHARRRGAPGPE